MCSPIAAGIALAASAITTVTGAVMSANAQSKAAQAVANQNWATQQAQYEGYYTRNTASQEQTAAQEAVQSQALTDRAAASSQMYQQEEKAIQQQQDVLSAENQQNANIRASTDASAQTLLNQTNAQNLQNAQTQSQQQAQALLASTGATTPTSAQGPSGTDPSGTDAATTAAMARRTAEAASNIRTYGSKVAAVQSYAQPVQTINEAITANKTGIMPAQEAASLLSSGSNVRLLPASVNFSNAQNIGSATDTAIQSREQQGLDLASLKYNDTSAAANLKQEDATTIAANTAAQTEANAKYDQSVGSLVSGLGNLGLYATGYFGSQGINSLYNSVFGSTPTAYTVTNHGA